MDTKHTYIFSTAAYNDDDVKSVQEVTCCVIKYKKARNIH